MPKKSLISKTAAAVFIILTVCAIIGIVTMIILDNTEISEMDPTPHPSLGTTITGPLPSMRLPKTLIPRSYKVVLQPHLHTRFFREDNVTSDKIMSTGNSTVYFHCTQKTQTIILHSKNLTIIGEPVVMNIKNNMRTNISEWKVHDDQSDFLEVLLEEPLEAGEEYSLFLAFLGEISENHDGLYISTYQEGEPEYEDDTGTYRFLAVTNLEPTRARTVFPCFDEPEMKAVFNVTIIHRRDTIALGNGAESGTSILDDEWQYTSFYPTPKMSTYLFAFTVSEFTSTPSIHEHVKIHTFARPEATLEGHTQYAANITGKILKFYEDYFEMNYQQKTLDQIALPDLAVAGMENWGLITYQEGGLLYDEEGSSLLQKQVVAILIAHELAHQWFGNLVTMKWWNQIWLNEGFATYMSYFAMDHVASTFKVSELFILGDLHAAFEEDTLASSHPLNPPAEDIQSTYEITELFDDITYSKGAIVLRMLADYVGVETFHKGIKRYLSEFSYRNTEQKDLWECIQKAVNEDSGHMDVATVMDSWTNQIGYPVITINTANGEVHQKHLLFNDSSESNLWWYIPIRVMSNTAETSFISLMSSSSEKKNALISKNGGWILANVNCTGYYRVNYDQMNWERLLTQLETDRHRIPLMNRGQLIDDAFNLARAKLVSVTLALNSTRFLRNENEYIPWESAVRNLEYFVLMFDRTEVYGPMEIYLQKQVEGLYKLFSNYTNNSQVPEDQYSQYSQITAIEVACSYRLPQCRQMASKMFAEWMTSSNNNRIHPNLRSMIYCHAVAAGGKREWEFAWNKFQNSSHTSEKDQLRKALSCTTKIWLLNRYLEYTLDPEKKHLLDVSSVISDIAENVAGHALAWNFIREHWEDLKHGDVSTLIKGVTSRFSKQFELEELESFATEQNLNSSRVMKQAQEQTQVNIQWVKEHKDVILEWFERQTAS